MHERSLTPSETGGAVRDIGGDVGALIVYTGREQQGREIAISPVDRPAGRDHPVAGHGAVRARATVRERQVRDGVFYSAVYADLPAGNYSVWRDSGVSVGMVTIVGGVVTEFVWPWDPRQGG